MNQSELKMITDDTLKELRSLDVITPEMYACAFETKLKELNKGFHNNLELDNLLANGIYQNLDKLFEIQNQTKESTQVLKENIDLATTAIAQKDDVALKQIKKHMIALQKKILDLEGMIYIDDLTKVYNRKWLYDKALKDEKFIYNGVLSFIDLDKFKSINDNYGHLAGDKVLFLIANLLGKIENAEVARLGGDEFVLISKTTDPNIIDRYLENINHSFENKSLKFQGHTFKISISYGSSPFKEGDLFQDITEIVDQKMYKAKRAKKSKELIEA